MNIQTLTLRSALKDFRAHHLAKMKEEEGPKRDFREGFCEALRVVEQHMVPALENTMSDVVEETENRCATKEDLRESEQRMLRWLREGPPEPGDEWKQG